MVWALWLCAGRCKGLEAECSKKIGDHLAHMWAMEQAFLGFHLLPAAGSEPQEKLTVGTDTLQEVLSQSVTGKLWPYVLLI